MRSWRAIELGLPPRKAAYPINVPPRRTDPRKSEEDRRGDGVFLNIPYDQDSEDLFLAYIAGLSVLGLFPRVTLEIAGGERRLDRIFGSFRVAGTLCTIFPALN